MSEKGNATGTDYKYCKGVTRNAVQSDGAARHVRLIEPMPEMRAEYQAFMEEFIAAGEEGILYNLPDESSDIVECIRRLKNHTEGIDRMNEGVRCSAFWLLSEDQTLLGEIHVRHWLTPELEDYGGHIGYMVRPRLRCKGHGTIMLELGLEKARLMGLARVLLTCERENAASARVILKNGGKLVSQSACWRGRVICRYRIDLQ
jgi:predicted acetyltransferase